jgi:hypothetical protein
MKDRRMAVAHTWLRLACEVLGSGIDPKGILDEAFVQYVLCTYITSLVHDFIGISEMQNRKNISLKYSNMHY